MEHRLLLILYFRNTNFLRQLLAAHSMSFSQNIGKNNSSAHFIHIWLYANNYPASAYEGKSDSCLAIIAGDVVQHGLIRAA